MTTEPTTRITLHPWELDALRKGLLKVILRPVEIPKDWRHLDLTIDSISGPFMGFMGQDPPYTFVIDLRNDRGDIICVQDQRCPYGVPGDRLAVCERVYTNEDGPEFTFASDGAAVPMSEYVRLSGERPPWYASRHTITLTGISAKRLEEYLDALQREYESAEEEDREDRLHAWDDWVFACEQWDIDNPEHPASGKPHVWVLEAKYQLEQS